MKLNVPYHKSKNETDCGPLALKMVLEFFNKTTSFDEIAKKQKQLKSGLVWTAGIARAAKKFGFNTKLISITNFSHDDIDYYQKYADDKSMLVLKELTDEIKTLGVDIQEKNISLDELLSHVTDNSVPIVLINWFVLAAKEGYSGHFVPLVGYDAENVYVHNPGLASAEAFMSIKRELFLKAWESEGTDKDVVVVSK